MRTEIRINERGHETHESWVLIGASRVQTTGARLFDSEIAHRHYISVRVKRCTRKRELNRDWLYGEETLLEVAMSQAQWGAFVSSFGQGNGVPATLTWLQGVGTVPDAPDELRFEKSRAEVLQSGERALREVEESYKRLAEAFETGGKKAQREALRDLGIRLKNAPKNMEFAAKSLTEHVENVVTKAKADIEGMALAAVEQSRLAESVVPQIESADEQQ